MTGKERIQALVNGTELDRTPISGWYHMPLVDQNVTDFTRELIVSSDVNHWDFIKIMTNGHFYTDAYGGEIEFSRIYNQWYGTIKKYPVVTAEDLAKLPVLGIENHVWQRELAVFRNLKDYYGDRVPLQATIFNPLTAVQECMGCLNPQPILKMMVEAPEALHHALDAMTQTNCIYLDALFQEGVDGIFLANQYSIRSLLTDKQYAEFVVPYEARILEHCKGHTWFNMAHAHGSNNLRMESYYGYGDDVLQALNWENCPVGVPENEVLSIREVRGKTDKVIVAGIDQNHDLDSETNDREEVKARLVRRYLTAKEENGSNRFVFAPGCAMTTGGSYLNALLYEVVEEYGQSK